MNRRQERWFWIVTGLGCAAIMFGMAATRAHGAEDDHPHEWTRVHKQPNGASCCSGNDASRVPYETAIGLKVGDTMYLMRFDRSVKVAIIHPGPPGHGLMAWGTTYGCLFIPQGF